MNKWNKCVLAAVVVMVAGLVKVSADDFSSLPSKASDIKPVSGLPVPVAIRDIEEHSSVIATPLGGPLEWVAIEGGKFMMGTNDSARDFKDAKPVHEVSIKTFEMSKTIVTVEQYGECVSKGQCAKPGSGGYCNWGKESFQQYPVNCVDWNQANQYANFKGGRLPSESEWEYAITAGGYKGMISVAPGLVCSKTAGQAAQVCEMAGQGGLWQWVQDEYRNSYTGVPVDGSALEGTGSPLRVLRGFSFSTMRADLRFYDANGDRSSGVGFRIARSIR